MVFALYWFVFRPLGKLWQNLFIIVASYVFYAWWDIKFLGLIVMTTLCSFLIGSIISKKSDGAIWLWCNIILNLGVLVIFKYYGFFSENMALLLGKFGISPDIVTLDIVLPVGISFYTFQAMGYTIDVYRRTIKPAKDIVAFFAFMSFFPQLVAGPIERATNLLPQFMHKRNFNYKQGVDGLRQILWGLFKKIVVADNCGAVVDLIFSDYTSYSGAQLLIAAILFSFQIYGDFSGYSDMAVGIAKLFGIELMSNFRTPYFSTNIAEFWRRWHISLTTWFRDYVYIPLGGSRVNKIKAMRNSTIIFVLSGFWHGANWTFIAWGTYHAILYIPNILLRKEKKHNDFLENSRSQHTATDCFLIVTTFILVMIGWIIFRSTDISMVWEYIKRMLFNFDFTPNFYGKQALLWSFIMLALEWRHREQHYVLDFKNAKGIVRYTPIRWCVYVAICLLCFFSAGSKSEFIYFQF